MLGAPSKLPAGTISDLPEPEIYGAGAPQTAQNAFDIVRPGTSYRFISLAPLSHTTFSTLVKRFDTCAEPEIF